MKDIGKIDIMVYKLYNFIYDEVKIVDPEFEMSGKDYEKFNTQPKIRELL